MSPGAFYNHLRPKLRHSLSCLLSRSLFLAFPCNNFGFRSSAQCKGLAKSILVLVTVVEERRMKVLMTSNRGHCILRRMHVGHFVLDKKTLKTI